MRLTLLLALALLVIPAGACGAGGGVFTPPPGGGANTPPPVVDGPVIVQTTPEADAVDVATTTEPAVVFRDDLDPLSIATGSLRLETPLGPVPALTTYDAQTRTLRLTFSGDLHKGTPYVLRILPGIQDVEGRLLTQEIRIPFETEAAVIDGPTRHDHGLDNPTFVDVQIDGDGNVVSLYRVPDAGNVTRVFSRTLENGGLLTTATELTNGTGIFIGANRSLSVGSRGDALFATALDGAFSNDVTGREMNTVTGMWRPLTDTIEFDHDQDASFVWAKVRNRGDGIVAWMSRPVAGGDASILARVVPSAQPLEPIVPVESLAGTASRLSVAYGDSGDGILAFSISNLGFGMEAWATPYNEATGFGASFPVDDLPLGEEARVKKTAVAPDGSTIVLWTHVTALLRENLHATVRKADGTVLRTELHPEDDVLGDFQVLGTAGGDFVIGWTRQGSGEHRVHAARFDDLTGFGTRLTLSQPGLDGLGSSPLVLRTNARGDAALAWIGSPATGKREAMLDVLFADGTQMGRRLLEAFGDDAEPRIDVAFRPTGAVLAVWVRDFENPLRPGAGRVRRADVSVDGVVDVPGNVDLSVTSKIEQLRVVLSDAGIGAILYQADTLNGDRILHSRIR